MRFWTAVVEPPLRCVEPNNGKYAAVVFASHLGSVIIGGHVVFASHLGSVIIGGDMLFFFGHHWRGHARSSLLKHHL